MYRRLNAAPTLFGQAGVVRQIAKPYQTNCRFYAAICLGESFIRPWKCRNSSCPKIASHYLACQLPLSFSVLALASLNLRPLAMVSGQQYFVIGYPIRLDSFSAEVQMDTLLLLSSICGDITESYHSVGSDIDPGQSHREGGLRIIEDSRVTVRR
jgi:hypothetical protein